MNIFVGSLPFKMKEAEIKELFEKYGQVNSVKIVIDKISRQNKGFGFVDMEGEEEAKNAIRELNGKDIMGRSIIVSLSEDKASTQKKARKPAETKENESKEDNKKNVTWRKSFFRKKVKESPIVYGNDKKDDEKKRENLGRKKAKNFKVGARKKK